MSSIVIKIDTDNAAFTDGNYGTEIDAILRGIGDRFPQFDDAETAALVINDRRLVRDTNGNTVGTVTVHPESEYPSLQHLAEQAGYGGVMGESGVLGIIRDRGSVPVSDLLSLSVSQVATFYDLHVGPAIDDIERKIRSLAIED